MSLPQTAGAQCLLCAPDAAVAAAKPSTPITIQIETRIDFSMIGLVPSGQGGTATLNPATGMRTLSGGLVDLGGLPVTGTVTVRGAKNAHVSVGLPTNAMLYNSSGVGYALSGFTTTLKNNPKLDNDGVLRFTFGASLRINGTATGTFRGTVPVTVDYR